MISARYRLNVSFTDRGFKPFFRGSFFALKKRLNGLDHSRIGVVLSKKYSKKATARNRIKRDIFRFFQENRQFLEKYPEPSDIVFILLTTENQMKDNKEAFTKELTNVLSL
jgi:ribonuclease P protein component